MNGSLLFALVAAGIVVAALAIGVLMFAVRRRGEPSPPEGPPAGFADQGQQVVEDDGG